MFFTSHESRVTRQHSVRVIVILSLLPLRAILESFPSRAVGQTAAGFDGSRNLARNAGRQLHELAARPFQREAVLVITARWIRPERGNTSSVLDFDSFRAPLLRRSVALRRKPPLDVPAIVWRVLRFKTKFDHFAQQLTLGVAVFPFPANPVQPRPSPYRAVIRPAKPVVPACQSKFPRDLRWRFVHFSNYADHEKEIFWDTCVRECELRLVDKPIQFALTDSETERFDSFICPPELFRFGPGADTEGSKWNNPVAKLFQYFSQGLFV
jgi:hypothetical protein